VVQLCANQGYRLLFNLVQGRVTRRGFNHAEALSKIILEGTRLTYKTEIAFALNEHPRIVGPRKYRYHSPIISAEWCAFTNFPWGGA